MKSESVYPSYPEYKDSGIEWLGEVPDHWEIQKFQSLCKFTGGGTPSKENLDYWRGGIPWVSPKDMKAELIIATEDYISDDGLKSSTSSMIPMGSLLIVVRSGILKHTIPIAIAGVPLSLNQDMKALLFDDKLCVSMFILRWVQGLNNALLFAWIKQGATVESIEHEYLANTAIPLPPVDEQLKIVNFLNQETSKIDTLIQKQQTLIAHFIEKRQAVISHAVTKGLNPDAPTKDSGVEWLGKVPEHWNVMRIATLFHEVAEEGLDDLPILSRPPTNRGSEIMLQSVTVPQQALPSDIWPGSCRKTCSSIEKDGLAHSTRE